MKKTICIFVFILSVILIGLFFYLMKDQELDTAYQLHNTTWVGETGYYGRLHRDGSYTFYDKRGNPMFSVPAEKVAHLR